MSSSWARDDKITIVVYYVFTWTYINYIECTPDMRYRIRIKTLPESCITDLNKGITRKLTFGKTVVIKRFQKNGVRINEG